VVAEVTISVGSADQIPQLRDAFLSLHDHHRRISPVPLTEPEERAWNARIATYRQHFEEGRALLHIADVDGHCGGYAFTVLHDGSDDTFPMGAGYAELYTLAVLPEHRGSGIGTSLLDAVDAVLEQRGVPHLTVAVMACNEAAIRLYRRRGLLTGELVMYRVGGSADTGTTTPDTSTGTDVRSDARPR